MRASIFGLPFFKGRPMFKTSACKFYQKLFGKKFMDVFEPPIELTIKTFRRDSDFVKLIVTLT
jgi:hypothetical protein